MSVHLTFSNCWVEMGCWMLSRITLRLASFARGHILEKNSFTCAMVQYSHGVTLAHCVQDHRCKGLLQPDLIRDQAQTLPWVLKLGRQHSGGALSFAQPVPAAEVPPARMTAPAAWLPCCHYSAESGLVWGFGGAVSCWAVINCVAAVSGPCRATSEGNSHLAYRHPVAQLHSSIP